MVSTCIGIGCCTGLRRIYAYGHVSVEHYDTTRTHRCSFSKTSNESYLSSTTVILDYGNSHVSDNGFHITIQVRSFLIKAWISSIIISSLDIFVNKRTLDSSETKKLFLIMKYIRQCFKQPEREFHSMNQIKGF